ncbi:MAG TPA: regulatory protein RecX [Streptosporangiaceae bacterium]|nr:regulatory protein RecX [Streptosporangiaceae bacterium]
MSGRPGRRGSNWREDGRRQGTRSRAGAGGLTSASQAAGTEAGADAGADVSADAVTSVGSGAADRAEADPETVARQICLRLLTTAPRTQAQLAIALRRRGIPDEAAAAVLARFAEVRLIDDAMFAKAWVESRHHGRGLAGRALGAELRQRGVAQDDIQAALRELDPEQELATARELVARRLAATAGMPVPARMRRLTSVLARKGYAAGLAYRVVREALEQEGGECRVPLDDLDVLGEPDDDQEAAGA